VSHYHRYYSEGGRAVNGDVINIIIIIG
jgi:hypothetical protein